MKEFQEIINTFIGFEEPDNRFDENYCIQITRKTEPDVLPPSMQKMELKDYGVGIIGFR